MEGASSLLSKSRVLSFRGLSSKRLLVILDGQRFVALFQIRFPELVKHVRIPGPIEFSYNTPNRNFLARRGEAHGSILVSGNCIHK